MSDGYPEFSKDDLAWFYEEVIRYVPESHHDDMNVARRKAGLDLELLIQTGPDPDIRRIFTAEVCNRLARLAARRTGVIKPLVYVWRYPHPEAKEALDYAARG